jgi:hypothetical protein
MNNVSLNNLTVNNIDNIANINVSSLTVNSIICNQPNETKLYFNSNNTLTTTIPSSTTASLPISFATTTTSYDFNINGSVIKNFKNCIFTTNLNCTVSPDISSQIVYFYDILKSGDSNFLITSVESDDINDITTVAPTLYNISIFTHTFLNNIIDTDTYIIRITFKIIPLAVTGKTATMYVNSSFPSYISIIPNYNVGYTANLTNNYLFSNPTTTGNASLSTNVSNDTLIFASNFIGTDVVFGRSMYLSQGVWNIEMYTVIFTTVTTTNIHLMLSYKKSDNPLIVYDTIPFYLLIGIINSSYLLKLTCKLVITTSNTYVIPYLRLLTGCTTPLTFKNTYTWSDGKNIPVSVYNITRIA